MGTKKNDRTSLRLLDWLLQISAGFSLAFLIALPLFAMFSTTQSVPVKVEAPYSVCWGSGITVDSAKPCPANTHGLTIQSHTERTDFGYSQAATSYFQAPTLHSQVGIAKHDTDARVAFVVASEAVLALLAALSLALHRVVGSAREGEPFSSRNVRRFRIAGASIAATWVVARVGEAWLNRTIDLPRSFPNVHVTLNGIGFWTIVTLGLGLLALAEIFRVGSELHEFEQAAI